MSEGDLPRKFRSRATGANGLPQFDIHAPSGSSSHGKAGSGKAGNGKAGSSKSAGGKATGGLRALWQQLLGQRQPAKKRGAALNPTLLDSQVRSSASGRGSGSADLSGQRLGTRHQRIEPFPASGKPVALPRRRDLGQGLGPSGDRANYPSDYSSEYASGHPSGHASEYAQDYTTDYFSEPERTVLDTEFSPQFGRSGYVAGKSGSKPGSKSPGQPQQRRRSLRTSTPNHRRKPLPEDAIAVVTFKSKSGPRPQRGSSQKKGGRSRRPQSRQMKAMVYTVRMLILSVGVGVLAGTLLSVWDPASRLTASNSQQTVKTSPSAAPSVPLAIAALGQEIQPLKAAIQALAFKTPQLAPGVFVMDLDTNAYLDLGGSTLFSAASTIKLPILIAFFQDVDQGKIRLDEMLALQQSQIATGSGEMQSLPPGTRMTAWDIALKMITISDNTATNMLIDRLGGKDVLDARFKSWGLTLTALNNRLPDIEGTNTTSAKELAGLLARINQGDLVSMNSRDRVLNILQQTVSTELLPSGLGADAKIAHKTGTIGVMLGDAGMVDLPNGKRYAIAVLVKRPFQDEAAAELIRQISKTTYDYFTKPTSFQPLAQPAAQTQANSAPSNAVPSNAVQPNPVQPNAVQPNPAQSNPAQSNPASPAPAASPVSR